MASDTELALRATAVYGMYKAYNLIRTGTKCNSAEHMFDALEQFVKAGVEGHEFTSRSFASLFRSRSSCKC